MQPNCSHHEAKAPARPGNQTVLWLIAILLAVIATTLIVRPNGPWGVEAAFANSPMVGARGIYAFTGQLDKNSYGLFMMDVDARTVWVYQYLPATRKMKLVAARSFKYDNYLESYNCDGPTEDEVRGLLDEQQRIRDRKERGGVGPNAGDEALGITPPGALLTNDPVNRDRQ